MGHIGGCQIHTEENIEKNPLKSSREAISEKIKYLYEGTGCAN